MKLEISSCLSGLAVLLTNNNLFLFNLNSGILKKKFFLSNEDKIKQISFIQNIYKKSESNKYLSFSQIIPETNLILLTENGNVFKIDGNEDFNSNNKAIYTTK